MCRTARKGGNGSLLWPAGVTSIEDVPLDLELAVEHAYKILDWYENLTSDEMPPKWMWHLDHELEIWFEGVEAARDEKYGGSSDESGPMMKNEFADEVRRR